MTRERNTTMPVVLVASQNAAVRRRLRQELEGAFTVQEVTERSALERSIADLQPTVLIFDFPLRQLGGAEGLRAVRKMCPSTKSILITSTPSEEEEISVLKAGVRGYCDRGITPTHFRKAVEKVQEGEIWASRNIVSHILVELASLTNSGYREMPPSRVNEYC